MALTRDDLEAALVELGRRLRENGLIVDIALFGGAAMILAFEAARMTRDVDAVVLGEGGGEAASLRASKRAG